MHGSKNWLDDENRGKIVRILRRGNNIVRASKTRKTAAAMPEEFETAAGEVRRTFIDLNDLLATPDREMRAPNATEKD